MATDYGRLIGYQRNTLKQALSTLIGITSGLIADNQLTDQEISFLHDWVAKHAEVMVDWPADILHAKIDQILADGVITEEERAHLLEILRSLVGADDATVAQINYVTELAYDEIAQVDFLGKTFCFTGDFVFGERSGCERVVESLGGTVKAGVSKKVDYLIVGSLGSPEWKHGSFGTKIERAMQLKREGLPLLVVRESVWSASCEVGKGGLLKTAASQAVS